MATWAVLKNYILGNYKVAHDDENVIKLVFDVGDLRSQAVFLWRASLMNGDEDWVQVESPIGSLADIDLRQALSLTEGMVCGGLSLARDLVVVRHAVPLTNLDINEIERPLILVTTTADRLEKQLLGGDSY